ncbi:MAG: MMPL family transporter [Nitrospirae bacterium]|nr:MMPL family transporter [Nitrospirota bacterium]
MISITFAVLFIGLGIDYSIQFCLRYRELVASGDASANSVVIAAEGVGRALILSCITTAIGFFSFVPTAYSGVAQLGVISGTGMFIALFVNLTVLPALLTLLPMRGKKHISHLLSDRLLTFPYRHRKGIIAGALILGSAAAVFLPGVSFNYNPLDLYSRKSEAVTAIRELFGHTESQPWTISVLVGGEDRARALAERLSRLNEVKTAITLDDFVPDDQGEKLRIISDMALFMPAGLDRSGIGHLTYEQEIKALADFRKIATKSLLSSPGGHLSLRRLNDGIAKFEALLKGPAAGRRAFASLEESLLSNLPVLFTRLETSLRASPITKKDLPEDLTRQYMATDGRYRVQVFPKENILDSAALKRFVLAVRAVAPNATDAPVTIFESGSAVVSSFREAVSYALVAIVLFLLFELRSFAVTLLILLPLTLAMLLTAAASVLLGVPLNFANVIVVPLLLGVGVHSGIIFILRYQKEPPKDGNMLKTSTARALLISTLTTLISTGSLSFSPHRGIASMGILLSVCFGFLILAILVLMPASLKLFMDRTGKGKNDALW